MSKLNDLILQYCPDGVEWKTLGEVCEVLTGGEAPDDAIKGKEPQGDCIYPIFSNGVGENSLWGYAPTYRVDKVSVTFSSIGTIGCPTIRECCYTPIIRLKVLYPIDESILNVYYLKYALETIEFGQQKSSVPNINANMIKSLSIPVPPLPVQEEIVRILENFSLLSAKLEAELEGRRKQFDFYRNQLLSFDANADSGSVQWKTLGEICTKVCSGGTPTSSNRAYYQGNIPWLRTQEVDWTDITDTELKITEEAVANSSAKLIPANCVIVAMYGATAAKAAINKIPLTTNQACCNLEIDADQALYRYVFHWLSKEYQNLKSLGQGSQSNLSAQTVKNYPIPIPSLSEQQRIVDILDRFDTLTNDLTQGLPAEIEARKKQYEHYRDKLLTFKRKEA